VFGEQGDISRILREDGYLLVVEDQELARGEHAHEAGFLVLDQAELRELFCFGDDEAYAIEEEQEGRLKAHEIPATYLTRVTKSSIRGALSKLKANALARIVEIRAREGTYRTGGQHAFWLAQFANVCLAQEEGACPEKERKN